MGDKNEYVRLCEAAEISQGQARRFVVEGHEIAVARVGEELFAIGDVCSHGQFLLSEGEVDADDCSLECPKHGSLFNLRTGEPETLPATVAVAVYPLKSEDGALLVGIPRDDVNRDDVNRDDVSGNSDDATERDNDRANS